MIKLQSLLILINLVSAAMLPGGFNSTDDPVLTTTGNQTFYMRYDFDSDKLVMLARVQEDAYLGIGFGTSVMNGADIILF